MNIRVYSQADIGKLFMGAVGPVRHSVEAIDRRRTVSKARKRSLEQANGSLHITAYAFLEK